jgi:2-methylisocitrate lyase-like PEP mutase family enzyme
MLLHAATSLRQMMAKDGLIWGPGVYDGISVRVANEARFPMLYMTGGGTSASRIGQADLGLTTLNEMVDNARVIAGIADVPVIADADTGFGGPVNVARTVHLYEQAGVAAIHIEDQTFPKRCGNLSGKSVVDTDEFLQRIRAATRERYDPDFVIIARTDARRSNGFDDAMDRLKRAFDAGADVGFFEAPQDRAEIERIMEHAPGPMLLNVFTRGSTPEIVLDEVRALGFKFAIFPGLLMRSAAIAMRNACAVLKRTGSDAEVVKDLGLHEYFRMLGLDEALAIDERASGAEPARA